MGCYNGAEIGGLVTSYIIIQLGPVIIKNDIGFCCDDGIEVFREISKPMVEKKKKTNC